MRVNLEARAAAAEQRKAQTRERLIEAAIAVIGEKGPDACSIEDFVAAAGVSRGTFYNYFPTAESLLQAVRVKIVAALTTVLDKRLPRTMPACERLATRLHSYLAAVTHDAAWSWMMLRLDGSRLERAPALEANLDEMYRAGVAQGRFREAVAEITGGELCDLVFDPVGGDIFDESTRCVAFGGKLLVIGFAGGRIAEISTNIPLIKGFAIVGVRAGEYARRFPERGQAIREAVNAMAAAGQLHPHIDRVLPLERWHEAFAAMDRREIVGKVVLVPGG